MLVIDKLSLYNYRNIKKIKINFDSKFTAIVGDNAQGKTNILESIYLLSNLKSFRYSKNNDYIGNIDNKTSVKSSLKDSFGNYDLSYNIINNKRSYKYNKKDILSINEILSKLCIISYTPSITDLVNCDNSSRRKFFDKIAFSNDNSYLLELIKFNRILNQRNIALKNKDNLDQWDILLAKKSIIISKIRKETISIVNDIFINDFKSFNFLENDISLKYSSSLGFSFEKALNKIKDKSFYDMSTGYTSVGAHRDKIDIIVNNREAKFFVSSGQSKLITFLLKIIEGTLFSEKNNTKVLFLYDDAKIFLDKYRFESLMNLLNKDIFQVIFSAVDKDFFKKISLSSIKIVEIKNGIIN